jgi:hypothetical protein
MKLKNYIAILLLGTVAVVMNSCDVTDLEAKDSPNALVPTSADITFYTNALQDSYAGFFEAANELNMEPVRMMHMFGPLYQNAYIPQSYDGTWSTAYATILQDVVGVEELAVENAEGFNPNTNHLAMAKIFRAMTYANLVDMFGDVPFEEANKGAEFLNPTFSGGQAIYSAMQQELTDAIALLELPQDGVATPVDWYYGSFDGDNWIAVANTFKMRMALNTGDAATFNAVLADGRFIGDGNTGDFQWQYSTVNANPNSRHPQFGSNYDNGGADYMSNDYMNEFLNGKSITDPRTRLYFYRQSTSNTADPNEKPCINFLRPGHYPAGEVFCNIPGGAGYWGRDHGDDDGIPPDNLLRTIWGLYPVGGKIDANDDDPGDITAGAQGAGITPIMLGTYVDFMRAEAAQKGLSNEGGARALLQAAIQSSMDKVLGFPAELGYTPTTAEQGFLDVADTLVDDYINEVLAEYDAASAAGQLDIIVREYWLAAWGNGYELYNAYRRTGYPANLQPTIEPNPGEFINSHFYPANFINRNSAVAQKPNQAVPVFWQTITDLD